MIDLLQMNNNKKNLRGLDDNSSNQNYCFLKLYFSANGTQLFSCKTIERVNHIEYE